MRPDTPLHSVAVIPPRPRAPGPAGLAEDRRRDWKELEEVRGDPSIDDREQRWLTISSTRVRAYWRDGWC